MATTGGQKQSFKEQGLIRELRNNICTISSQLFDNFILLFISYLGIMEVKQIIMLSITSWIIEVIVALLDTPILYLTRKWKRGLDNGNEVEKR